MPQHDLMYSQYVPKKGYKRLSFNEIIDYCNDKIEN